MDNARQSTEFQYAMVGDMGVGKTCLINQFAYNCFSVSQQSTSGLDLVGVDMKIGWERVKLVIWSTLGHQHYSILTITLSRNADGVIFMYDVTNRASFESIRFWMGAMEYTTDPIITLVGNKTDLETQRQVSTQEGEEFAREQGFLFLETSAKTGENIPEAFFQNMRKIQQRARTNAKPTIQKLALDHYDMSVIEKLNKKVEAEEEWSKEGQAKTGCGKKCGEIWSKILAFIQNSSFDQCECCY